MHKLIIGCGYLGRRVAAAWLQAGHSVTALTRSENNAAELSRLGITPVIGDVCDPKSLAALPVVESVLFAVAGLLLVFPLLIDGILKSSVGIGLRFAVPLAIAMAIAAGVMQRLRSP